MAAAARCPTSMPCLLKALLAIAASDASRCVARVVRSPARPGNVARSGAVETRLERTSYAAVATAALTDAFAPARSSSRYWRCFFGPIALTASYTAPCTMPMLIWRAGAAPPFGGGNALSVEAATWFQ